jgi:hypothetical protein
MRLSFAVARAYNGAGLDDVACEHQPPLSFREATTRYGGGISAKCPLHRRQTDRRCTCPNASLSGGFTDIK